MLHIFNAKTGVHTEYVKEARESGRNVVISFEIIPSRFGKKEFEAVRKIPCFCIGLGYFKSMKQAKEAIESYYDENYDILVQLKELGNHRVEFDRMMKETQVKDMSELSKFIDASLDISKFPLVTKEVQRTQREKFRFWSSKLKLRPANRIS